MAACCKRFVTNPHAKKSTFARQSSHIWTFLHKYETLYSDWHGRKDLKNNVKSTQLHRWNGLVGGNRQKDSEKLTRFIAQNILQIHYKFNDIK